MTKFNSKRKKLKYVWDLSQQTEYRSIYETDKQQENKSNFININRPSNYLGKMIDFSTEWENFISQTDRIIYQTEEINLLNIPEEWISNIYSDIIFRGTNHNFSLETNFFYKVKTLQIEDIEESNNKNITLKYQLYFGGQTDLFGLQIKVLCYLLPNIKLSL